LAEELPNLGLLREVVASAAGATAGLGAGLMPQITQTLSAANLAAAGAVGAEADPATALGFDLAAMRDYVVAASASMAANQTCELENALYITHLAGVLAKLVSIISQPDRMRSFNEGQCMQAVTLSRMVQQQLKTLFDRCEERLDSIKDDSRPNWPNFASLLPNQPTALLGAAAAAARAPEQLHRSNLVDSYVSGGGLGSQWPMPPLPQSQTSTSWPDSFASWTGSQSPSLGASTPPSVGALPQDSDNLVSLRMQLAVAAVAAAMEAPPTSAAGGEASSSVARTGIPNGSDVARKVFSSLATGGEARTSGGLLTVMPAAPGLARQQVTPAQVPRQAGPINNAPRNAANHNFQMQMQQQHQQQQQQQQARNLTLSNVNGAKWRGNGRPQQFSMSELETLSAVPLPEEDVYCPGLNHPLQQQTKKQTLGMHLTDLHEEDPKCVFIVRRVSCMGFQSQELLAQHYSQYGSVKRVLVAHSKVKPVRHGGAAPRIRPGGLGFIVMESFEVVRMILAQGKEQLVVGCHICVEPFEQTAKPKVGNQGRDQGGSSSAGSQGESTATGGTGSGSRSGSNGSDKDAGFGMGSNCSEKGSDKSDRSYTKKEASYSQQAESSESGSGNEAMSPFVKKDGKRDSEVLQLHFYGV